MGTELARIMIVEDERIVARDLAATLVDLGYAVTGMVGTGEEAIVKAKEWQPDLVLMDIRLAGSIDGVEASSRIKSERDTPIIFLTSHSDRETLRRATVTAPARLSREAIQSSGAAMRDRDRVVSPRDRRAIART